MNAAFWEKAAEVSKSKYRNSSNMPVMKPVDFFFVFILNIWSLKLALGKLAG